MTWGRAVGVVEAETDRRWGWLNDSASSRKSKVSDADGRIFGVLAIVEDQHAAVRAGLQGAA